MALLYFLVAPMVKASGYNSGDLGLIPVSGRSPGEGNGFPLQYSCLENPMDRGHWQATIQRVANKLDATEQLTLSLYELLIKNIDFLWSSRNSNICFFETAVIFSCVFFFL